MDRLSRALALAFVISLTCARAQVIEFKSNGLRYQTLTRSSVTMMWAQLSAQLHEYGIIQVAVSNGSPGPYVIRPEDFHYVRPDGSTLNGVPARNVVYMLSQKGSGSDVIKLITAYETSVYGNSHFKSTNGYEQRRQAALTMSSNKFRAAATASALALAPAKLVPGDSTDGAVFFITDGKPLGPGRMIVRTNTDVFDFSPPSP